MFHCQTRQSFIWPVSLSPPPLPAGICGRLGSRVGRLQCNGTGKEGFVEMAKFDLLNLTKRIELGYCSAANYLPYQSLFIDSPNQFHDE